MLSVLFPPGGAVGHLLGLEALYPSSGPGARPLLQPGSAARDEETGESQAQSEPQRKGEASTM